MKVFVAGYWNTNLGDDLFLMILARRYPHHDFYIISGQTAFQVFRHLSNVHQVRVPFWIKVANRYLPNGSKYLNALQIKIVQRFTAYCEVGGSLFMLPPYGLGKHYQIRAQILATKIPYYVIGSNFGPYYSQSQVKAYWRLFQQMRHITFRDRSSYQLFADLKNINYAPDMVFNLDVSEYTKSKDYILISVINPTRYANTTVSQRYYDNLVRIIKKYVDAGERVVLMSFCATEGDLAVAQMIKHRVASPAIEIFNHTEIDQSLQKIAGAKAIIASRYHAMILSWLFAKPTFVISYSNKTTNVLADLFPTQPFVNINDLANRSTFEPRFKIISSLDRIKKAALGQFTSLDELLE